MSTNIFPAPLPTSGPLVYVVPGNTYGTALAPAGIAGGLVQAASIPASPSADRMMLAGRLPPGPQVQTYPTALVASFQHTASGQAAADAEQRKRETGLGAAIGLCALMLTGVAGWALHDARRTARIAALRTSPRVP